MAYSKYILLVMMFSLVFLAACGGNRKAAMRDPVAQAGTSSEEVWYQYGGARMAYTAVTRPKQLYTGYGAVRDPALYGQAPATTQEKASSPRRYKAKPKVAAPASRDPNCPPCPPADATKNAPPSLIPQASPAFPAPAQGAASFSPSSPVVASGATGAAAPPPSPPMTPLPSKSIAIPAPLTPAQ